MLIDTHAHLCDSRYTNVDEIINQCKTDGVDKIITVSYDMASSYKSLEIAKMYSNVYCAVGVHPSESNKMFGEAAAAKFDSSAVNVGEAVVKSGDNSAVKFDSLAAVNVGDVAANSGDLTANNSSNLADSMAQLLRLSQDDKCVAIGEIGLDYHYDDTDKAAQRKALIMQLELVQAAKLPAIFHLRDAYGDMLDIIKQHRSLIGNGAVMHCFSGSVETARTYVDMGFYISFSGSITFKNNKLGEVIRAVPTDRLLIETDCPYLTPSPFRGKVNYPNYVRYVADEMSNQLCLDKLEVARITSKNAHDLFFKMK